MTPDPPPFPQAVCTSTDPDVWYPHDPDVDGTDHGGGSSRRNAQVAEAKRLCGRCDHQLDCANHALTVGERFGVWGGLTAGERKRLRAKGIQSLEPGWDALT